MTGEFSQGRRLLVDFDFPRTLRPRVGGLHVLDQARRVNHFNGIDDTRAVGSRTRLHAAHKKKSIYFLLRRQKEERRLVTGCYLLALVKGRRKNVQLSKAAV